MVQLEPIKPALFPNLYRSFLVDDDPLSTEQDWRHVFDYAWENPQGHCGYALLDEGQVVGMLGMVFRNRRIAGEIRRFCNLHTWWVREDHRGRSLSMLRPVLKLNDHTITHFTPCDRVRAVSRRLGFQDLDTQLRILLPLRNPYRQHPVPADLIQDGTAIEAELGPADRQIFQDHQPYGSRHLLVTDGERACYLLYTVVVRHRLPYCHIHYVSDPAVFARREEAVRSLLIEQHRVCCVALDARLTQGMRFRRSFGFWAPGTGLYKSADVTPDQIDHLYSDVVFLKLTMLPDFSYELRKRLWHWWPFRKGDPPAT